MVESVHAEPQKNINNCTIKGWTSTIKGLIHFVGRVPLHSLSLTYTDTHTHTHTHTHNN